MKTTLDKDFFELIGDDHQMTSVETPLRKDAFLKSDEQKMASIAYYFKEIMLELGLDLTDDSLMGTPHRVAKMYVQEIFSGLNPANKPKAAVFDNSYGYSKMLIEGNIHFNSTCEHHFLPIVGKAHIAYISSGKVIGLSKLNRIVDYFSKRPQVQERLTRQIYKELERALETKDIIVVMEATHLCVSSRGIKDISSYTTTMEYGGAFNDDAVRNNFFGLLKKKTEN
jgi:GTP cyclohydrolase I